MIKSLLLLKKNPAPDLALVTSHINNFIITAVTTSNSNFIHDRV